MAHCAKGLIAPPHQSAHPDCSAMSLSIFACCARYVQGRDATARLGEQLKAVGIESPVLLLAGQASVLLRSASGGGEKESWQPPPPCLLPPLQSAARLLGGTWQDSLTAAGYAYTITHLQSRECTALEIEALAEEARRLGARALVGCGGGKVRPTLPCASSVLSLDSGAGNITFPNATAVSMATIAVAAAAAAATI